MDSQAKKKAMYRSKPNAKKYNESDKLVCRVCNVVLKPESLCDVHQASHKPHEAINNLKVSAATLQRGSKAAQTQPRKLDSLAKSSKP